MYKLEGKLLEEYLQIVLDVQKRNVLLRELKTDINDDRSDLQSNSFIRERAKEAKESVLNRVMYGFLICLVSLIAFAETWGLFIFWVYFLIEFWKDGFNNFENCLAIILCSFTSIGWFLISIAAWYGILFLINQYRKELKNVNSMPDDYSENKTLSKEKVILLKPEIDALNELWEVWSEIEEYWNSNTYDVSTRVKSTFECKLSFRH